MGETKGYSRGTYRSLAHRFNCNVAGGKLGLRMCMSCIQCVELGMAEQYYLIFYRGHERHSVSFLLMFWQDVDGLEVV